MDATAVDIEMLSRPRKFESDYSVIVEYDKWRVRNLILTQEKAKFLWEEMNKYKALFSDFNIGNTELFSQVLTSQTSLWYEVIDEDDAVVGVLYMTDMDRVIDCEAHVMFFDHQLQEKAPLCRQMIAHIFKLYPLRRMTVTIPSICYALIRWAGKVGFREEGRKRESLLMGNRWVDQVILGILRSEAL